ncbi:hypothetical protein BZL30_1649 [Mycobacterium kansasii]|uniref:Transposase for insertion sequence element IS21-like C-terminal domain-containing protein n=1 Tax=Mycobacterium kansasii TaxID=1768 RepID=A0A1V3XKJ1_MYCKA|nr:hypothetical protein BZL30_1649 [Mycobacterium kansasii]
MDRDAQVIARCNQYSVPVRFIGHRVRVKLSASAVIVYDRNTVVARHQRAVGKGAKVLDLDHYLEILLRKPGALPGATALAQARASTAFTAEHQTFWTPPAKPTVTPAAPGCSWRCCCCTATSTAPTCWPASAARSRSGPPAPMWWPWKPARPPTVAARRAASTMPTGVVVSWCWPSIAARQCLPMSVRCPRWRNTTRCWGGKPHDPAAQCHRTRSRRSDRAGPPHAAPADHP